MRRHAAVFVLICVVLAAACGGRVTSEQVLAEAAEDGVAGGGGLRSGTGSGSLDGSDGLTDGGTLEGGTTGGTGGSGTTTGGSGGTGSSDPSKTSPAGGNGGATDVGVTKDRISFGNVSTLSGPVPGLFRGALVGAQAWAAMINSQGGIDGRQER